MRAALADPEDEGFHDDDFDKYSRRWSHLWNKVSSARRTRAADVQNLHDKGQTHHLQDPDFLCVIESVAEGGKNEGEEVVSVWV